MAQVDKDLRTMLLKPDAPQPRVVGVRVWPRAIPQFNIGHLETLDKAKQVRRGARAGGDRGCCVDAGVGAGHLLVSHSTSFLVDQQLDMHHYS